MRVQLLHRRLDGELIDSALLPTSLIEAVSEQARLLIIGDRSIETGTEGLSKLKVDVIELTFDKLDRLETISDEVYQMISHLGRLKNVSATGGQIVAVPLLRS